MRANAVEGIGRDEGYTRGSYERFRCHAEPAIRLAALAQAGVGDEESLLRILRATII
jgi:hypothetical protein